MAEIHNGDMAESCQWPSTVALLRDSGPFCTGTLIHPRFVLTAAHCIDKVQVPVAMGFGEDGFAPERTVDVVGCTNNPLYYQSPWVDMSLCELATPVEDVQPVPIAQGCELDGLAPDAAVQIVGYGHEQSWFNEFGEHVESIGLGSKRFTPQAVYELRDDAEEIDLVGLDEFSSACFGDSGGGAFFQLADGSWRVVGIAQELFFPPGTAPGESNVGVLPDTDGTGTSGSTGGGESTSGGTSSDGVSFIVDPTDDSGVEVQPVCGPGATYTMIAPQMAWIESVLGEDASPCFTSEGEWDPGPTCTPFPTQLHESVGTWASGCAGEVGGEPQCGRLDPDPGTSTGAPPGDPPDDSDGGNGSSTTSDGDVPVPGGSSSSTSGPEAPSTTSGVPDGPDSPGGPSGESSTGEGPSVEGGDAGCGCRGGGDAGGALLFVLLPWLRRRRFNRS